MLGTHVTEDIVYDRKIFPAGKVFIKEGEEAYHAYLVQSGTVRVYKTKEDGDEIEITELGAGAILGESALILDEPRNASAQAVSSTTVIVISRDDFERKMQKVDETIQKVLKLMSMKLGSLNKDAMKRHEDAHKRDFEAEAIVDSFCRKMSPERQEKFKEEITPHMTGLIRALKNFKG